MTAQKKKGINFIYTFEPGNAAKYRIAIASLQEDGTTLYLVSWLNGQGSPSFLFSKNDKLALDYICDKMKIGIPDGTAIMTFAQRKIPIYVTDLFQWQAILGLSYSPSA